MEDFQAVGLDFEEGFVARQFLDRLPARRQNEPSGGARFHFFDHGLHPWNTLVGNLFERKRPRNIQNLVAEAVFCQTSVLMSANPDPDASLMLRVKRGDTEAFAELVDKYKQPVMNLVFRLLRDATEIG